MGAWWRAGRRWWELLSEEQSAALDGLSEGRLRWAILLASAAALYVEMVMVRWHATCFHAFAIFKNVSLLSCFLGLGVGFALSGRRRVDLSTFLPLLALQTLLFGGLSCTALGRRIYNPVAEQMVMGNSSWSWGQALEGSAFLLLVFTVNAWMFVPLGHLAGRLMGQLPRVRGYSLNLLGSLAGIGLFFVLSLLWTGPEVWLGLAVLAVAPFLCGGRRAVAVTAVCSGTMLTALGVIGSARGLTYYSPYQVITFQLPNDGGAPSVRVNHCYYQAIVDCSSPAKANSAVGRYHGLPYRLAPAPGDVLVVGAGTGNDVAAALRHGARSVTAVELDPAIVLLGRQAHPECPYANPRTRVVVNDARTFIRQTNERFDTIVYGLLDSHTNLGALTNVRVDSFVYTVEAFREAIGRLKDDGLVVVSYDLLSADQGKKLFGMLREAYPDLPPRAFTASADRDGGSTTFVTGPGLKHLPAAPSGLRERTAEHVEGVDHFELATDDWPFFYMKHRTYPFSYLIVIGLMLGVSVWMIRWNLGGQGLLSPGRRGVLLPGRRLHADRDEGGDRAGADLRQHLVSRGDRRGQHSAHGLRREPMGAARRASRWALGVRAAVRQPGAWLGRGLAVAGRRDRSAGGGRAAGRADAAAVVRRPDLFQRAGGRRGRRLGAVGEHLRGHAGRLPGVQLDVLGLHQPLPAGHRAVWAGAGVPLARGRQGEARRGLPDVEQAEKAA